ncbi:MAG: helix-turn-helix transcriptional regulator [Paracoccaceae bacterium]
MKKETPNFVNMAGLRKIFPASESTIERKLRDPKAGFPEPIRIGRLRYWDAAEVVAWVQAHARQTAQSEAA